MSSRFTAIFFEHELTIILLIKKDSAVWRKKLHRTNNRRRERLDDKPQTKKVGVDEKMMAYDKTSPYRECLTDDE